MTDHRTTKNPPQDNALPKIENAVFAWLPGFGKSQIDGAVMGLVCILDTRHFASTRLSSRKLADLYGVTIQSALKSIKRLVAADCIIEESPGRFVPTINALVKFVENRPQRFEPIDGLSPKQAAVLAIEKRMKSAGACRAMGMYRTAYFRMLREARRIMAATKASTQKRDDQVHRSGTLKYKALTEKSKDRVSNTVHGNDAGRTDAIAMKDERTVQEVNAELTLTASDWRSGAGEDTKAAINEVNGHRPGRRRSPDRPGDPQPLRAAPPPAYEPPAFVTCPSCGSDETDTYFLGIYKRCRTCLRVPDLPARQGRGASMKPRIKPGTWRRRVHDIASWAANVTGKPPGRPTHPYPGAGENVMTLKRVYIRRNRNGGINDASTQRTSRGRPAGVDPG